MMHLYGLRVAFNARKRGDVLTGNNRSRCLLLTCVMALARCTFGYHSDPATSADRVVTAPRAERSRVEAEVAAALGAPEEKWVRLRNQLLCRTSEVFALLNSRRIAPASQSRVRALISEALLHTISMDALETRYPALHRLVAQEIENRRRRAEIFKTLGVTAEFDRVEAEFANDPGLSVPALENLTRHENPRVRIAALGRMFKLGASLPLMAVSERLRKDDAEITVSVGDTLETQRLRVSDHASLTEWVALRFALWHRSARATPDATERTMTAVLERVAGQQCKWSEELRDITANDEWGNPVRLAWSKAMYVTGVVMWSYGPNGTAGDDDDVVRFMRDCRDFRPGEPPSWTAAAGGITALPPITKSFCD